MFTGLRVETTTHTPRPPVIKIIFLGESSVGKTTLVARYDGFSFASAASRGATVGIEMSVRQVRVTLDDSSTPSPRQITCMAQVIDTAGMERFHVLTRGYMRGANLVLFIFDLSDPPSYRRIWEYWLPLAKQHYSNEALGEREVVFLLVGNKKDLIDTSVDLREVTAAAAATTPGPQKKLLRTRFVSSEAIAQEALSHGILYYETSATDDVCDIETVISEGIGELSPDVLLRQIPAAATTTTTSTAKTPSHTTATASSSQPVVSVQLYPLGVNPPGVDSYFNRTPSFLPLGASGRVHHPLSSQQRAGGKTNSSCCKQ